MAKSGLYVRPFRQIGWLKVPDSWVSCVKYIELYRHGKKSREWLEAKKQRQFRKLLRYAQKHSPFYQEIIERYGINIENCSVQDFPVLTKSVLMENFDRVITDRRITKERATQFLEQSTNVHDLFLDEYRVIRSSGTSGGLGYSIFSSADWLKGLAHGYRLKPLHRILDHRDFAIICATGGHYGGEDMVAAGIYNGQKKKHNFLLCETNDPLEINIEKINAFQPEILGGYVTSLKILAEKRNEGLLRVFPTRIETFGEMLSPSDKSYLEKVFKCNVVNLYGSSEHLLMGIAKSDEQNITLYDDELIYEFFDDHTLTTNLFNYTLPLIRYKSDDVFKLSPSRRDSPYIQVESLIARNEAKAGFINKWGMKDFITSYMIQELHEFHRNVRTVQLRPRDHVSFDFLISVARGVGRKERAEIIESTAQSLTQMLQQKEMDNVHFDIVPVDEIPINPVTRKFQLIVNPDAHTPLLRA